MKRPGKLGGYDPKQLRLDWSTTPPPQTSALITVPAPAATPQSPLETVSQPIQEPIPPSQRITNPDLVQRLPWDFVTSFPQMRYGETDDGIVDEYNATPETIRSLHELQARELLTVLHDLDGVLDARRHGVDPPNQKKPMLRAARDRLDAFFDAEPARLEYRWQWLMGTYEEAFGPQAAHAFSKAVRARHAGIPVIAEPSPAMPSVVVTVETPSSKSGGGADAATKDVQNAASVRVKKPRTALRRAIARLPVPKPLPHAVAAGHFGHDENGRPVNPSADEVREITENHAEILIDLLTEQREAERRGLEADRARLSMAIQVGFQKYAEDFGERAGEQLLAYCRRQTMINDSSHSRPGRKH